MASGAGDRTYAVTLERGTDGMYLAWVDDLPGCAVRAPSRAAALERLPGAISDFTAWIGDAAPATPNVRVVDEIESALATEEDTEALVAADRSPLTGDDWSRVEEWLRRSRRELMALLAELGDDRLEARRDGSERTVREEIEHVAFVELMYAAWTFDLRSRRGLAEFLAWTRDVAAERLRALAEQRRSDLTWAHWGGAPRPEPWTPRKAARRLLWHELLHLRMIQRFAGRDAESSWNDARAARDEVKREGRSRP